MGVKENAKLILQSCMDIKPDENVLVVTDDATIGIGQALYEASLELGTDAMLLTMAPRSVSGEEPPAAVAAAMKAADVVLCPMQTSITHTNAKIEAAKAGARIATMPGITDDMFSNGAMTADYTVVKDLTEKITALLDKANVARIEKDGCVLTMNISGRPGKPSTGVYKNKGEAGNLPSGEAFIAPLEDGSEGTMIIDGSMVGVGLLEEPIKLFVSGGKLRKIEGYCSGRLSILLENENNATLCEFGIGTNYAARITGVILEDEKASNTVHIAFGTNTGFGGLNKAGCHIDGIIKEPTVYLDDIMILDKGRFIV